jgi:hypothetical protein
MKSPDIYKRLTSQFCAALLLLTTAAPAAHAQRRRHAARTRTRATTSATPATPTPATTNAHTQQSNTAPARQTPPNAPSPARAQQPSARHADSDLSIEEMLGADSYSVYMEFRRVGALAQSEEVKTAVASLTLFGGAETKPLTDLYRFLTDNEEALSEARVVTAFLPARAGLPQALTAVGLATPEAAAAFEPKYRRLLGEQMREVKKVVDPAGANTAPPPQNTPDARQRGAAQPNARQGVAAKPPDVAFRRVGRWLVAADSAFTLKSLRGEPDAPRLSQSTRFQAVRSRFANETLFVYVDTTAVQAAWALQVQRMQEAQPQPVPTTGPTEETVSTRPEDGSLPRVGVVTTTPSTTETPRRQETQPAPEPSPEEARPEPSTDTSAEEAASQAEAEARMAEAEKNLGGHEESLKTAPTPPPPSEEELAVRGMGGLMRSLWGGVPRIPGAVALGVGIERGSLAVRLAVENTPDGTIALIPFLPNLVSGPPVTTRAAEVAPADAELFFSGSLDWEQLYNSTLGAASLNLPSVLDMARDDDEGDGPKRERPPSPDETIKAIEKVFGFKFREDLLPALGHEIAFSMPLDAADFGIPARGRAEDEKKEERDAEPGFVLIISLNDPDKVREILPRVLAAFGVVAGEATWSQPEKRAGFELRAAGSFAYTTIGDFLVLGEPKAVRHCIDSYDARRTLAATNAYRDATDWQARQKLAHIFVSDSIAKDIVEATRKRSGGSTDPAVMALLAQLETAETAPASYEATNEGDVVIHEMRLPFSLIKTYAAAVAVGVKDAPVLSNESMALYALQRIGGVESDYKDEKKKGRYGTLEELVAEGLLEKEFLQHMEYRVELTATSDKFEATATPKTYGKTGRRSFFVNESGKVRAADRKGEPATADDPTVEQ